MLRRSTLVAALMAVSVAAAADEPRANFMIKLEGAENFSRYPYQLQVRNVRYGAPASCLVARALAADGVGRDFGDATASRQLAAGERARDVSGGATQRDVSGGTTQRDLAAGQRDRDVTTGDGGRDLGAAQSARDAGAEVRSDRTGAGDARRDIASGERGLDRGAAEASRMLGAGVADRHYSQAVMTRLNELYSIDRLLSRGDILRFVDDDMVRRIFGAGSAERELICVPSEDGFGFTVAGLGLDEEVILRMDGMDEAVRPDEHGHVVFARRFDLQR